MTSKLCSICNEYSVSYRCSDCKITEYCSRECQIKDWNDNNHDQLCSEIKMIGLSVSPFEKIKNSEYKIGVSFYSEFIIEVPKNPKQSNHKSLIISALKKMFTSVTEIDEVKYRKLKTFFLEPDTNYYFLVPIPEGKKYNENDLSFKITNSSSKGIDETTGFIGGVVIYTFPNRYPTFLSEDNNKKGYESSPYNAELWMINQTKDKLWAWAVDIKNMLHAPIYKGAARASRISAYKVEPDELTMKSSEILLKKQYFDKDLKSDLQDSKTQGLASYQNLIIGVSKKDTEKKGGLPYVLRELKKIFTQIRQIDKKEPEIHSIYRADDYYFVVNIPDNNKYDSDHSSIKFSDSNEIMAEVFAVVIYTWPFRYPGFPEDVKNQKKGVGNLGADLWLVNQTKNNLWVRFFICLLNW
jgi:MYND finger